MKQNEGRTPGFDAPWEDGLIVVVRDLQWLKTLERLPTRQPTTIPSPMFKFGGTTENAIGDVGISANDRFFLLEFKRDGKRAHDEIGKPLVKYMKALGLSEDSSAKEWFLKSSRRGHHFVFSEEVGTLPGAADSYQIMDISIVTTPYYDEAVAMQKNGYLMKGRVHISGLLYPPSANQAGLPLDKMAMYLRLLLAVHEKVKEDGQQSYEFKGAIVTDSGFIWPLVNLDRLDELLILLEATLLAKEEVESLIQATELLKQSLLPIFPTASTDLTQKHKQK
jgi:hypothetical protein